MLHAKPIRIFSSTFSIREGESDVEVARLRMRWWSEKGTVLVEGHELQLRREGVFSGAFLVASGDAVIAKAHKPSAFQNRFLIDVDDVQVELRRAGVATRTFELLRGDEVIGTVERGSLFTRSARIHISDSWPVPLQVFVLWLVLIIWRRMNRA